MADAAPGLGPRDQAAMTTQTGQDNGRIRSGAEFGSLVEHWRREEGLLRAAQNRLRMAKDRCAVTATADGGADRS